MIAVHPFTLSNGLTCLFLEDPGAKAASVQVWFRVGSAHETPEIFGLPFQLQATAKTSLDYRLGSTEFGIGLQFPLGADYLGQYCIDHGARNL